MKTYDEMTRSIMSRAKAHRAARNRWIGGSVAAVCALGICLGAVTMRTTDPEPVALSGPQTTTALTVAITTPTEAITAPTEATTAVPEPTTALPEAAERPRVMFLNTQGKEPQSLEPGLTLPLASLLRVRDIRGLTNAQIEAVCREEVEYAKNLWAAHSDEKGYDRTQFPMKNVVLTSANAGHFILDIEDWGQLESIHASVEGAIDLMHLPDDGAYELDELWDQPYPVSRGYLLAGNDLEVYYQDIYGGYEISWRPSNEFCREMDESNKPLSEYGDTISFTITFKDGTVETYDIDMMFSDNGEVYAMLRSTTAAA